MKTSRMMQLVGVLLILAGIAVMALMGGMAFLSQRNTIDDFARISAPGVREVFIDEPGTYTIYEEGFGFNTVDGQPLEISINRVNQPEVPLTPDPDPFTYSYENREGRAALNFDVPFAGRYQIDVGGDIGSAGKQLAIGKDVAGDLLTRIIAALVIGLLLIFAGAFLLIFSARQAALERALKGRKGTAAARKAASGKFSSRKSASGRGDRGASNRGPQVRRGKGGTNGRMRAGAESRLRQRAQAALASREEALRGRVGQVAGKVDELADRAGVDTSSSGSLGDRLRSAAESVLDAAKSPDATPESIREEARQRATELGEAARPALENRAGEAIAAAPGGAEAFDALGNRLPEGSVGAGVAEGVQQRIPPPPPTAPPAPSSPPPPPSSPPPPPPSSSSVSGPVDGGQQHIAPENVATAVPAPPGSFEDLIDEDLIDEDLIDEDLLDEDLPEVFQSAVDEVEAMAADRLDQATGEGHQLVDRVADAAQNRLEQYRSDVHEGIDTSGLRAYEAVDDASTALGSIGPSTAAAQPQAEDAVPQAPVGNAAVHDPEVQGHDVPAADLTIVGLDLPALSVPTTRSRYKSPRYKSSLNRSERFKPRSVESILSGEAADGLGLDLVLEVAGLDVAIEEGRESL